MIMNVVVYLISGILIGVMIAPVIEKLIKNYVNRK